MLSMLRMSGALPPPLPPTWPDFRLHLRAHPIEKVTWFTVAIALTFIYLQFAQFSRVGTSCGSVDRGSLF